MAKKKKLPKLYLKDNERQELEKISRSQKAPFREVQRAKILLEYADNTPVSTISRQLDVCRPAIYKCIKKALATGPLSGLKDKYHRPTEPSITIEAKTWVLNLACTKPNEIGYAANTWTYSALAKHTRKHAPEAGHECLKRANKSTIWRILKEHPVQPHKIRYYLEKRDEDFEPKMRNILAVYAHVNLQNRVGGENKIITVSMDEKPGVQAIRNKAPDLPPKPGKYPQLARDAEYERLGTLSILAALDLHDGHVFGQVHDHHRSEEFIQLLKDLDEYYPKDCKIRIILDNHSIHISKETMEYLASVPNRFIYVHTPKHGSWLNIIETLFSKMARTFLRHLRVESKEELRDRILKWFEEINEAPVIHRWTKFNYKSWL
jgi:transposase